MGNHSPRKLKWPNNEGPPHGLHPQKISLVKEISQNNFWAVLPFQKGRKERAHNEWRPIRKTLRKDLAFPREGIPFFHRLLARKGNVTDSKAAPRHHDTLRYNTSPGPDLEPHKGKRQEQEGNNAESHPPIPGAGSLLIRKGNVWLHFIRRGVRLEVRVADVPGNVTRMNGSRVFLLLAFFAPAQDNSRLAARQPGFLSRDASTALGALAGLIDHPTLYR